MHKALQLRMDFLDKKAFFRFVEFPEPSHKALSLTRNSGGKVAMLLRNEFDCAAARKKVFGFPFDMKIVLQKRPRWIDGSTGSPRHNYAWYIWDWKTTRDPVIRYDK